MGAKYMGGYKSCSQLDHAAVESMGITVPVAIHLDHGHYERCAESVSKLQFSIMFDSSAPSLQLNLKWLAKDVVEKKAHAKVSQ